MRREKSHCVVIIVNILLISMFQVLIQCHLCIAQSINTRLDDVVQHYVINKQFMGSVLVAQNEEPLLDRGYGYANLEWKVENSPETKFRIASLTKQFTAASILLLEERGKLKINDLITKYIPDAPAAWDKITIFNLLTHTSGIPNFTDLPGYTASQALPTTPAALVARFRDKPLDFEPGKRFEYSNSGYVLLGFLIEEITGQRYGDFVRDNIFRPLGMKDSGYDSNSAIVLHRASGYSSGPHGPVNAECIDMSIPFSAGGLYSTTRDLLQWEQGLFGGRLLSRTSLKEMTTPFLDGYALGLKVSVVDGHTMISHAGDIDGFDTAMGYYPDEKLIVIVLGNLNGKAPIEIAKNLASVVQSEER